MDEEFSHGVYREQNPRADGVLRNRPITGSLQEEGEVMTNVFLVLNAGSSGIKFFISAQGRIEEGISQIPNTEREIHWRIIE